ncbi:AGZA family xanthine/uracil permease-like MFS transporter [Scopulibacillus daqui]|uniref:AGZA family xanthine/uracil permease-like MFS transporter n=1 Tax=Scopulibacillus daqui TaxID=1469162 RepID=A0ABS2PX54_9BACL|nr:AGZA family xanthine/uracil permease-like MFS transporter [Scopulibacillus daqui]
MFNRLFRLKENQSSVKTELMAGLVSFFTIVYIIAVNASILSDAGIPMSAGIVATILVAFVGSMLMGFWANAPMLLVPGMGINALFTYTIVQSMGLSWKEALAAVFISGILFAIIAFTSLSRIISNAIPHSLKESIGVGIGLFLAFIGLQKGGIVVPSQSMFVQLGHFGDPHVLLTIVTLILTLILFARNVPGNLLIGIISGTVLSILFGQTDLHKLGQSAFSLKDYQSVFAGLSFKHITSFTFWMAVFSLTLVTLFENIGLTHGFIKMIDQPEKYDRSLQATALSVITCGLFGTSPSVSTVESASGIASGGRTGLTTITTGVLFLGSLLFIPFIKIIPDTAVAPVLILIGGLMISGTKNINFADFTEGFPSFLIIACIPLTSSIVDGIALGFIAYPILKIAKGKAKEVAVTLYIIAALFLIYFIFQA